MIDAEFYALWGVAGRHWRDASCLRRNSAVKEWRRVG